MFNNGKVKGKKFIDMDTVMEDWNLGVELPLPNVHMVFFLVIH